MGVNLSVPKIEYTGFPIKNDKPIVYDYVQLLCDISHVCQINRSSPVHLRPSASGSAGYGDVDLI